METTQLKNFADYSPYSYRNWCEKSEKEEIPRYAAEIQLFSDANFIGSRIEHGSYTVMNAQPYSLGEIEQFMYARLALRYEQYSDLNQDPTSTFWKTDTPRYHGGNSSYEIASLYSLCWAVRIKGGDMESLINTMDMVHTESLELQQLMKRRFFLLLLVAVTFYHGTMEQKT